jgi:hypothetical protein
MEKSIKTITVSLVIATCAFLGYYLYMQKDTFQLSLTGGDVSEKLFVDVQKYIERRNILSKVQMDTKLFSDERFRSLRGYSTEVASQPVGRTNPFDEAVIRTIQ